MVSTNSQPPFNLFYGSRAHEPLALFKQPIMEAADGSEEGGGSTSGPIDYGAGFHT
jgi:hypothetical protein